MQRSPAHVCTTYANSIGGAVGTYVLHTPIVLAERWAHLLLAGASRVLVWCTLQFMVQQVGHDPAHAEHKECVPAAAG